MLYGHRDHLTTRVIQQTDEQYEQEQYLFSVIELGGGLLLDHTLLFHLLDDWLGRRFRFGHLLNLLGYLLLAQFDQRLTKGDKSV